MTKYKCIKSYPGRTAGEIVDSKNELKSDSYFWQDYPEYWQPVEEEKDYSEFIVQDAFGYYVNGKRGLLYYDNGTTYEKNRLIDIVDSIEIETDTCLISELKIGDTVYIEDGEMKQEDFMIYVGKDEDGLGIFQFIIEYQGIEKISHCRYNTYKQVIKFI